MEIKPHLFEIMQFCFFAFYFSVFIRISSDETELSQKVKEYLVFSCIFTYFNGTIKIFLTHSHKHTHTHKHIYTRTHARTHTQTHTQTSVRLHEGLISLPISIIPVLNDQRLECSPHRNTGGWVHNTLDTLVSRVSTSTWSHKLYSVKQITQKWQNYQQMESGHLEDLFVCSFVAALSPVNHGGLHQGCTHLEEGRERERGGERERERERCIVKDTLHTSIRIVSVII